MQKLLLILLAVICLATSVGCTTFGGSYEADMRAKQLKNEEFRYFTYLTFGTHSALAVESPKKTVIAGRKWNFAELWGTSFKNALGKRGIESSDLIPTRGGQFYIDDVGNLPVFGGVLVHPNKIIIALVVRNAETGLKDRLNETIPTVPIDEGAWNDEEAYDGIVKLFEVQADKIIDVILQQTQKNGQTF